MTTRTTPLLSIRSRKTGRIVAKDESRQRRRTPAFPRIREMRLASCHALLRRGVVGRLAFSFHDRVDITPIHYIFSDGWLFARTSHGAKMTTIQHVPWVAFEVDEVEGVFDWRSVVVHGSVYLVEPGETPSGRETYERTIARLRELLPSMFAPDDPAPHRTVLFRIHVDRMTGRSASSA